MTTPSLLSSRRFAPPLRGRLQVIYAKAFEALAETYSLQAAGFVRRLDGRLNLDDALDRFFREIPVPVTMRDTVRSRAVLLLTPTGDAVPHAVDAEVDPWTYLRPDLLFDALRRRAQYVEAVNLAVRLAVSVAEEAVVATHVRMAIAAAEALDDELPPDEAVMHYLRAFELPSVAAQMIFQRALAQLADRVRTVPRPEPVALPATAPVCLSGSPTMVPSVGVFGVRVMA